MKKLIRVLVCLMLVFMLMVFFQEMTHVKTIVDFKSPYTYSSLKRDITKLKFMYPQVIKSEKIGLSAASKKIPLLKLGKGEKKALIVAGIHSREYLTVTFTMRCIEEYAKAYCSDSGKYGEYNLKNLLNEFTLFVVPCANPDGLNIVTDGEKTIYDNSLKDETYKRNTNGVNLNRNFPFCWEEITDGNDINYENFKGKAKASEPETKALINLCKEENFEWMFSMHLKGNNVFWRDVKNGEIEGDEKLVNRLSEECGYIKSEISEYANAYGGGFENWFRATFKKNAFCIELVPIDRNYNYEFSRTYDFENLTNWYITKYTFIQGMI